MSKPIVVIVCMLSSSESWEPQTAPTSLALACRWRSRPQHQNRTLGLYNRVMNDAAFAELSEWLTQAGLAGTSEIDIVSGCCERCVAAGLPLARVLMLIDTLH